MNLVPGSFTASKIYGREVSVALSGGCVSPSGAGSSAQAELRPTGRGAHQSNARLAPGGVKGSGREEPSKHHGGLASCSSLSTVAPAASEAQEGASQSEDLGRQGL